MGTTSGGEDANLMALDETGTVSGGEVPSPLLQVSGISVNFGGLRALNACSFGVAEGQIYSVIGPNGAGKSTAFNVICGIYKPVSGKVLFMGRRIDSMRSSSIAKRGIGRSFQNVELFQGMTSLENVMVGAHLHIAYGIASAICFWPSFIRGDREARAAANECLGFLGIVEAAERTVEDLPYGIQKKVEIARALASKPKLLLLDEPAAGLNEAETLDLMNIVRRIRDELGITVLLVEHNMRLVMGISDRVCALNFGSLLAEGTPREIQTHPDVIAAYLGEDRC